MRIRTFFHLGASLALFSLGLGAQLPVPGVGDTTDATSASLAWFAMHAWPIRAVDASADDRDLVRWDALTAGARDRDGRADTWHQ